jgi:hypothetical protein
MAPRLTTPRSSPSNGLVIMNSGYGLFGQGAGNVMIAFKPKQ